MARKKTVSISRKPTLGPLTGVGAEPAVSASVAETEPAAANPGVPPCAGFAPAPGPLARAVYGAAYCLSYGLVFGVVLVGKLVPGSGLIGRGLRDGGGSALRYFDAEPEKPDFARAATYAA